MNKPAHGKYLIVHTSWYREEMAKIIEIARKNLGKKTLLLSVPGSLELAAGAKRYINEYLNSFAYTYNDFSGGDMDKNIYMADGIMFCGIIIRGETSHYDLVTQETFRAIGNLALQHPSICMVNNVICVENKEQLIERLKKNTVNNSKALKEMYSTDYKPGL